MFQRSKKNNDYCTIPFKLCPKQKEEESKQVCKEVIEGKLTKVEAEKF